MAFKLDNALPWGRNLQEYRDMFRLHDSDLEKKIVSIGDGPASFNVEMTRLNKQVVSLDPIYRFSTEELRQRIGEAKEIVLQQTQENRHQFTWAKIKSLEALEQIRMAAMNLFLEDFEIGKQQGRYIVHEMPTPTDYKDLSFDLGLSSHFLLLYAQLGWEFHIHSISEMLRLCREVRLFPILNLSGQPPKWMPDLIKHFEKDFQVTIEETDYEFQKNGHKLLLIRHFF